MIRSTLCCFLVAASLLVAVRGQQARAVFNAKAIQGYIHFTVVSDGIRIQTQLTGLTGRQRWHVHLYPVDQTVDPNIQCTPGYVGPHYDPFNRNNGVGNYTARCLADPTMCEAGDLSGKFGYVTNNVGIDVVDNTSSLFLRGRYSIVGRSIVIHSPTPPYPNFACATIRSLEEIEGRSSVTVLQSTFVYPIAGVMYLKQVEGEEVQMWGKMYWVNGNDNTTDHNWHIHLRSPGEEFRRGMCNTSGNIGGHYDPFSRGPTNAPTYSQMCSPDMVEGCEVGDLTGKHATINVPASATPFSWGGFFFTDSFLNLTGTYGVVDRSMAIHQANRGGPVVACAPLIASETITLRQYGEDEVTISQTSPFEYTTITNSRSREMTVIQNSPFSPLTVSCYANSSLVFDDYGTTAPSDSVTPDRFLVGSLSNRYGGSNGIPSSAQVFNLPVYGANSSISSLNLRAFRSKQNNCSALLPSLMESNVMIAKATFTGNLRGAIYFIQRDFRNGQANADKFGNTHIIVDIYRAADRNVTSGHSWRIISGSVPASGCSNSASATYNPYTVNTGSGMSCSPEAPLGCVGGDLSGKHGSISIGSNTASRPTYTFVDNNILLDGSYQIVGNSLVVLTPSGDVMDCATISRVYLSANTLTFTASRSTTQLKTSITSILAGEVNVDFSDVLVLGIRTTEPFNIECTEASVKILGTSQSAADSSIQISASKLADKIKCVGGAIKSATVSALALAFPLLLSLFHLVFRN